MHREHVRVQRPASMRECFLRWYLFLMLLYPLCAASEESMSNEYILKAAFLFKISKYVTLDSIQRVGSVPFGICIIGKDPFGSVLDRIVNLNREDDEKVSVVRYDKFSSLERCQAVYISDSERDRLEKLLEILAGSSILTVSDIEGFAAQVPGHKIGEEFTIDVKFPDDYHDNTLKSKAAVFTIKINEIKRKAVPELNDETAKKLGPYETLDALKADLQKFLDQKIDEENQFRSQKAIIESYVDKVEMDLPNTLVDRESRVLWNEVQERFKSQGLNWEQYVEVEGQDKILANFQLEAHSRLRTSLAFSALAKAQGIQVSQEEYQTEVINVSRMRGVDEKVVFRYFINAASQSNKP